MAKRRTPKVDLDAETTALIERDLKKYVEEKKGKAKKADKQALLRRIRDRVKLMIEADDSNRKLALDDLKFANEPGAQWEPNMKKERGDRPCYEFNKCRINGKKVINEIRANRPQIKVRAVEGGDKEGAELREGLFRNIANMSDLETITDQAAEYQVDAGYAVMRVDREYAADAVFDQDILIRGVKNSFCVYSDPSCKDILLRRDADDWAVTEKVTKKAFESKYKDAEKIDFDADVQFDDDQDWEDEETVRVVEYWWKEPTTKEIWLVEFPSANGEAPKRLTVDSTTDEAAAMKEQYGPMLEQMIVKRRMADTDKIMMCVASGTAILEGPSEQVGTQFPFVPVYGEVKVIDGKVVWWGLHRFAKDAQRSYNIARTNIDETIALAPKAVTWATPEQAKGHMPHWAEAHKKNFPVRLYNPDPQAPGAPQQHPGAQVPVALIEQAGIAAQDIRDVTGLHEASFGEESGEKSGVALARKQNQAQIVTYNFPDNMAKAVKRIGEIVLDYIPHVYDAERELRIIGADGAEDYLRVNQLVFDQAQMRTIRVNDLSAGRYDFAVTPGPGFATQRQEFTELLMDLAARSPEIMQVAGDLFFKAMDMPYSDEIAERWQTILPPAIQKQLTEGKEIPPEAQAVMAQAEQAMQMVQQQTQLIQAAAQEVQQDQAKSEKAKAEVEKAIANLKTAEAQFEAKVAKVEAQFVQREAQLGMQSVQIDSAKQQLQSEQKSAQEKIEGGNADLSEAQKAVEQIDGFVAQFMETAAQIMGELNKTLADIKAKPRVKAVRAERVNGQLRAVPEYEEVSAS